MKTKDDAIAALKKVIDPELGIDVYKMGLIYKVDVKENDAVHILMTLTTPFCPMAQSIMLEVKKELQSAGFKDPEVELTFDPPWEPNDAVKALMGL